MIAALGDLQVSVVGRGELDALGRDEIGKRVVGRRRFEMVVNRTHHFLVGIRSAYRQHLRVAVYYLVLAGAQTPGHDNFAVFVQGFANGVEGFLLGLVDESTGVDHDQVGFVISGDDLVALDPELSEYAFGINQGLRAPEADESNLAGHLIS